MEPMSTASADRALARVSSGSGFPVASKAAPPSRPSSISASKSAISDNRRRTPIAGAITSGPMPSPGNARIAGRLGLVLGLMHSPGQKNVGAGVRVRQG